MVIRTIKFKTLAPWKKSYDRPTASLYSCESWTIKLSPEELMFSNFGAGEDSWESLGQQGAPTSQSKRKSTLHIHWKDWCWSSNTLATRCKEPTHWKRPWCWERLRAERKGGSRGWDGWIASPTQWSWIRADSGRWQRTGKPGMLLSMGLQRVGHDLVTEQQQKYLQWQKLKKKFSGCL